MSRYLFKSARLGFRNWLKEDLSPMSVINEDPEVMNYFPATQGRSETTSFIARMQKQFDQRGYNYFAVELLEKSTFIGFIGLSCQDFESPWTPFTDIGWRLDKAYWGQGLVSEGAKKVLHFAFNELKLREVYATAPKINNPSIRIMDKIGMHKLGEFKHPKLPDNSNLKDCVVYKVSRQSIADRP
jgi:RimJ/RimL family protein N-acetyltransferase